MATYNNDLVNVDIHPELIELQARQAAGLPPPIVVPTQGQIHSIQGQLGPMITFATAAESVLVSAAANVITFSLNSTINVSTAIKVANNQVVSGRKTGWGSPGGTLSRAAYSGITAASLPVGAAYTQSEIEAIRDAVVALSQRVAALLTDLHSATSGHGLIGP